MYEVPGEKGAGNVRDLLQLRWRPRFTAGHRPVGNSRCKRSASGDRDREQPHLTPVVLAFGARNIGRGTTAFLEEVPEEDESRDAIEHQA